MNNELATAEGNATATAPAAPEPEDGDEDGLDSGEIADETLGQRYHIARSQANKIYLPGFLRDPQNATDPAFQVRTITTVADT